MALSSWRVGHGDGAWFSAVTVAAFSALIGCASSSRATLDGSAGGRDGAVESGKLHGEGGGSDTGSCTQGAPCGDGGVCAGGACCPAENACGATCCGGGLLCSFSLCVRPGAACFDSTGCAAGQYCQYPVGATGDAGAKDAAAGDATCVGGALPQGVCLPAPPTCPGDAGAPEAGGCIESCQYHPAPGPFTPVLKYSWGGQITSPTATDVMMAPVVLPMEDTNCDGKVNGEDIPDIVFTTFASGAYETNGTLHAIAVRNGSLVDRWAVPSPVTVGMEKLQISPATQLAGGDLDGLQGAEVAACLVQTFDGGTHYGVAVFHPDGSLYWSATTPTCLMPSIADLNQDGKPEVITEGGILDGQTGALTPFVASPGGATIPDIGYFVVSDINGDGILDVVTAEAAYDTMGTRFVNTGVAGGFPAIGDLYGDGTPDVIFATETHAISAWRFSATGLGNFEWVQRNLDMNATGAMGACASVGGGPPTVADFNGDGTPDIALAGSVQYTIFDGKKITSLDAGATGTDGGNDTAFFLWSYFPTDDCSSAVTGSTIFDFTGDGRPEALYSDQQKLRIFNGPDGGVLFQTCNTTGTLIEYPLVVDVDNDGHADIVVVSNAYAIGDSTVACQEVDGGPKGESGVRVFSDPNLTWVRTRAIWNEHPYHITNVNDDGTIPTKELANWKQAGLNNFRQNKAPGTEFAAPDAVVSIRINCGNPLTLTATVSNIGEAALPSGVLVDFYGAGGSVIGSVSTSIALYSAQSQTLVWSPPTSSGPYYAVVDPPGAPAHPGWHECRTDNNTSAKVSTTSCPGAPK